MARVLISMVGTGPLDKDSSSREYRSTKYSYHGQEMETSFIAMALKRWLNIDRIILLGTVKSMWEEVYRAFCQENGVEIDDDYYLQIAEQIDAADYATPLEAYDLSKVEQAISPNSMTSKIILLKYGIDHKEQEENFGQILKMAETLADGDELFLDFTHSFRSHGLFLQTAMSYITDLLPGKVVIKDIFYGMYEAKNNFNGTPIVSLYENYYMQQMIKAAYEFQATGKGYALAELLQSKSELLYKRIKQLSNAMSTNYAFSIPDKITKMKESLASSANISMAEKILTEQILSSLESRFQDKKNTIDRQLAMASWMEENKQYGQAYLILKEIIINIVCKLESFPCSDGNTTTEKSLREEAKNLLFNKNIYKKLKEYYNSVNSVRNEIAHFSGKRSTSLENDVNELPVRIAKVKKEYHHLAKDT